MNKLSGVFPLLPMLSLRFIFILAHIISDTLCLFMHLETAYILPTERKLCEMNCFVHCVSTGPRKVNHI